MSKLAIGPGALRGLLLAAGLVAGLLGAEIAIRALRLAPEVIVLAKGRFRLSENPSLVYERVPGLRYEGESLDFYDFRGSGNSLGYRSPDYGVRKPRGTQRIIVLGDSVAEGLGVLDDDALFARRIESGLRRTGRAVEVLNFAVSGYNTQQEVETLSARALAFSPDVVLVAYVLNDEEGFSPWILGPLLETVRSQQGVNPILEGSPRWLLASALYRFLRFRVLGAPAQRKASSPDVVLAPHASVEQSLGRLAELAQRRRFAVVVAVFPVFEPEFPGFDHYRYASEHERIKSICARLGFLTIDLLPAFTSCASSPGESGPLFLDLFHLTEAGHACAARSITDFILANKVLGR